MKRKIFNTFYPIYRIYRIYRISNIYNENHLNFCMKKRVDVTLDEDVCKILEQIRSEPQFRPSLSEVINSLLKTHPEIKKRKK